MNGGVQLAGPVKVTRQAGSAFVAAAPAPLQTCLLAINTDCQPQLLQRNWQHAAADMGVSQQDFALNGRLQQGAGKLALPRDTSLQRSEEHTSELQSRPHLVCRLLLEKKKEKRYHTSEASNKVR